MDRDRLYLTTPEGVTLDLPLAGVGSRATAAIVDSIIQFLAMALVFWTLPPIGKIVGISLIFFGYHLLFELLASGQSPGKSMMRLRVVRSDGGPVTFVPALIRSLLRLVDALPGPYVVGMVAVFSSTRNQRLGDMAAGTVVLQEPETRYEKRADVPVTLSHISSVEGWDVTAVTDEEIAVVRRFLSRRFAMDATARSKLAVQLANRLAAKVHRPAQELGAERFLLHVLTAKERRSL